MARRRITEDEVNQVLRDYYAEYPGDRGKRVRVGAVGARTIKVVFVEGSDPPLIVTVAAAGEDD